MKLKYLSAGRTSLIAVVNCGGQNATPAAFLEMFSSRGGTPATPTANRALVITEYLTEIAGILLSRR